MADLYPTQKGYFKHYLYEAMKVNKDIYLVLPDLGYGIFDQFLTDFPERVIQCGASESASVGIAVGLALEGKIPFVYSITNFILYRPFEWIRNYIDHEKIPVKLVAGGRDTEYQHDGYSHHSEDAKTVLQSFPNLKQFWVEDKEQVEMMLRDVVSNNKPCFISLSRSL